MRRLALLGLLLLLLVPTVQAAEAPSLTVLVHHPVPDDADPLGVAWRPGVDGYYGRYRHLDDGNGFDFPHVVFDGTVPIEGIPDSGAPYASTRDAYQAAFARRAAVASPASLNVTAALGDEIEVEVHAGWDASVPAEGLRLFVAVVEDAVHYAPPPALSNGVTIHPFVVRAMQEVPLAATARFSFDLADAVPSVNDEQLFVAAWIQNGAVDGRFEPHEVLQSVMHRVGDDWTRTDGRSVLMEMYSATWCDTCLFGDRVAEEMADAAGIERSESSAPRASYLQLTAWFPAILIASAFGGILIARLPRQP